MAQHTLSSVGFTSRENLNTEVKPETKLLLDVGAEDQCEYREDIWQNLLELEAKKTPIHLQSPQLEFRGTLVQRLRDASRRLGLNVGTLHAAVAQLDLFMDAHRLRADRLTHVAMACLSLAVKSEENFNHAPNLKTLSKISGVQLCGKTFRQLEWMVGQHLNWRLLAPTPVTFAALISHCVVSESDLTSRHPKFVKRFKQDGAKLLEAYLDLTLSDVRLKVVETVDVGCACVACARADLGLCAWPPWLVALTGRKPVTVAPVARLLQRMMQILKSREETMGCSSHTVPYSIAPCETINQLPPSSTVSSSSSFDDAEQRELRERYSVLDLSDESSPPTPINVADCFRLPTAVTMQRVDNPADYRYCRSSRLLEASFDPHPSTSAAMKRGLDSSADLDAKRYRVTVQMSQVCL